MQVFKNLGVFFLVLILAACGPTERNRISMRGGSWDTSRGKPADISFFEQDNHFKVAMLLPLSGKSSPYGQGLKNAAMMAVEDADNADMVVHFYDTQSSSSGAETAALKAIRNGSHLILGPLTANEVSAVSRTAKTKNIPVISFSTSPEVLQQGIYTLGLLGGEQVERIIGYAVEKGRKKIALLIPDTDSGINLAKVALKSAPHYGAEIIKIGFYPPETLDFAEIVKSITDYEERSAEINKQKELLTHQAKAGDIEAEKELKRLKTVYTTGAVDFDALLIPETGSRLKSAVSMFGYYDISYPDVLFLGTSVWENTNLSKETTLYHGVYPVMSRIHNNYFNEKYETYFGAKPNQLFSFAYDGVALASALARKNSDNLEQNITDREGYIGINGAFRILPDGTNQHSLDIMEVTSSGPQTVDTAPKKFRTASKETVFSPSISSTMPKIYGKDQFLAEKLLFNHRTDSFNDFTSSRGW